MDSFFLRAPNWFSDIVLTCGIPKRVKMLCWRSRKPCIDFIGTDTDRLHHSSIFKDITAIITANTPPLLPLVSFENHHLPPPQHTLQMWWHLNTPSHHGFPPLGPSPWRWELGPWIQSLGNQQHQQQEQQCPVSTMQEHQRDRERWRPVAARKFALWREDITNFITSHIQNPSTAHSTSEVP